MSPTVIESGRPVRSSRRPRFAFASWRVALVLAVSGWSYSPTQDLFGSYFPAWMLCAVLGVAAAVIIRQILVLAGINDYIVVPLLTYAGLAVSGTLLAWLLWFGH